MHVCVWTKRKHEKNIKKRLFAWISLRSFVSLSMHLMLVSSWHNGNKKRLYPMVSFSFLPQYLLFSPSDTSTSSSFFNIYINTSVSLTIDQVHEETCDFFKLEILLNGFIISSSLRLHQFLWISLIPLKVYVHWFVNVGELRFYFWCKFSPTLFTSSICRHSR